MSLFSPLHRDLVLLLLLYEYKDQILVETMYMIVFLLPVGFSTITGYFRR